MTLNAFLFPGQGSQRIGMLSAIAAEHSQVQDTFAEASNVLGIDLYAISQGDDTKLNSTEITQPALLAASVALWRIWSDVGGAKPAMLAGHSLGEYSALVCAGALDFTTAVEIVNKRGKYMQEAVPAGVGKMAAIVGLDDALIEQACAASEQGQIVSPANFNSQGQTVIAGDADAVERAMLACKDAGAKRVLPLNVSVPSHCGLMHPAAERMRPLLTDCAISAPAIPVLQNVSAAVETDVDRIRENLLAQLYSPVRWVETIEAMVSANVSAFVECGPGKVLTGLVKRIDRKVTCQSIEDPADFKTALER